MRNHSVTTADSHGAAANWRHVNDWSDWSNGDIWTSLVSIERGKRVANTRSYGEIMDELEDQLLLKIRRRTKRLQQLLVWMAALTTLLMLCHLGQ